MSGLFGEIMAEPFAYQKDAWEPLLRKMGFYMGKFIYFWMLMKMLKKIKRSRIIILWRFTAKKRILKNLQGIC